MGCPLGDVLGLGESGSLGFSFFAVSARPGGRGGGVVDFVSVEVLLWIQCEFPVPISLSFLRCHRGQCCLCILSLQPAANSSVPWTKGARPRLGCPAPHSYMLCALPRSAGPCRREQSSRGCRPGRVGLWPPCARVGEQFAPLPPPLLF